MPEPHKPSLEETHGSRFSVEMSQNLFTGNTHEAECDQMCSSAVERMLLVLVSGDANAKLQNTCSNPGAISASWLISLGNGIIELRMVVLNL